MRLKDPLKSTGAPDWVYDALRVTVSVRDRALAQAARDKGEPLTTHDYEDWRQSASTPYAPSSSTIEKRWGWSNACEAAGVEPSQRFDYGLADLLDEVIRVQDEIGKWPTITQYEEHHRPGTPSRNWFYSSETEGVKSWSAVIDRARERAGE
jgi:hypothetical protein